ncbi:hypothetical protein LCGC14_2492870 [marine sediment metagenome]|uniref:Uncharacterized protein n=1 Tax=marine sediment metagenome TaxID=412755 RepID=A0A0F9B4A9_9ZZZZ
MNERGYSPEPGTPQGSPPDGGSGTAKPPDERKIRLRLDQFGYGLVELGGVDVSKYTQELTINTQAGDGTVVTIGLAPGIEIDLDTDAGRILVEIAPELADEEAST